MLFNSTKIFCSSSYRSRDICKKTFEKNWQNSQKFGTSGSTLQWIDFVATRAIVRTTDEHVYVLNIFCFSKFDGNEIIDPSGDSRANQEDATQHRVVQISTLRSSGTPPNRLVLQKKALIMLLRNLNIKAGLCSGTRLILEDVINDQILKATIINREFRGKLVLMPKIVMQPAD